MELQQTLQMHPIAKNDKNPFVIKMRELSRQCIINKQFPIDNIYTIDVEAHQAIYSSGNAYIYWYIICNISKNNNKNNGNEHPFNRINLDDDEPDKNDYSKCNTGGIVADNLVTRSLLKGLEEIHSTHLGMSSPGQYAAYIIGTLATLWD